MAKTSLCISILGFVKHHLKNKSQTQPSFISTQVAGARRYYLDLNPASRRGTTVVCGGCERMRTDYVVDRKDFPFFAIEFVAEGSGTLQLAGINYRLTPGMAFAYGPGVAHSIRSEPQRPMLKYYVDFMGDAAKRLLAGSILGKWCVVRLSSPQELVDVFELLQREGSIEGRFSSDICSALLEVLIMKIDQQAVPSNSVSSRSVETFQRARRVLQERSLRLRTAEDVASACHVDPSYLSRLFQRFAGTTPYRFMMKLKMAHAAELLLDRQLMVKEVADRLGFSDAFHFSRVFKRVYGVSPSMFLRHSRTEVAAPDSAHPDRTKRKPGD